MVQLTPKMQNILKKGEKSAKNALTSHYANGHGDRCDKWVKKHVDASTGHQVYFLKGFGFFHTCQHVWGVWKSPEIQSHLAKFGCRRIKVLVYFFQNFGIFFSKNRIKIHRKFLRVRRN